MSVEVQLKDGSIHFDQIYKKLISTSKNSMPDSEEDASALCHILLRTSHPITGTTSTKSQPTDSDITSETAEIPVSNPLTVPHSASIPVRRNLPRNCKPPEKLTY